MIVYNHVPGVSSVGNHDRRKEQSGPSRFEVRLHELSIQTNACVRAIDDLNVSITRLQKSLLTVADRAANNINTLENALGTQTSALLELAARINRLKLNNNSLSASADDTAKSKLTVVDAEFIDGDNDGQ